MLSRDTAASSGQLDLFFFFSFSHNLWDETVISSLSSIYEYTYTKQCDF